ncbi:cob(I)yrinic acid a,c-diamide adenosyltransferase [Orrella marina]|uniref:Cobalamin adenosyltransferase n=1 Tax=Orrella marina TaxID=2163011 RepID=A0A2R4XLH2_9BURK|nr:cob(I)yrinic acid a,c-diamide adenosyltransferase [Orrella marina]AWB34579.1 cob(I)yrinic acid a,c-diamide adenosyltransferase [Orrella marina]
MANRLTVISTRTGDDGTTGLADGSRVPKTHARVAAMGDVDELNSSLGLLVAKLHEALSASPGLQSVIDVISPAQHALFDLGSELAIPGHQQLRIEQLKHLDDAIDTLNSQLPPLQEFILPGGDTLAAQAHIARAICRRAERSVVLVSTTDMLNPPAQQYLNRLADLLFILARTINRIRRHQDILWAR